MGEVYKAEHRRLGRVVALKFLSPDAKRDPQAIERFSVEARLASALNHPNICTIYDVGQSDTGIFIVMEFLDGQSLRQRIDGRALAPAELLNLAIQAADGLAAAHAKGIVHRDIKPENLFIVGGDRLKILDFGLAKLQPAVRDSDTTRSEEPGLTHPGTVLGTLPYMSPEQARGEEGDPSSDLFGLGAVLFEMAARRRAFPGASTAEIHAGILKGRPQLPARVDGRLRPALQAIIDKGLEKQREFRYQHASEMAADLRRLRRDYLEGRLPQPTALEPAALTSPSLGRQIAGDFLRAAAIGLLGLVAHDVLEGTASGRYLDQFQMSLLQEDLEHGSVSQTDFEAGGRHLPLVVDVSSLHPDKRQPTDRTMLDTLIDELRRNGARAIGVDLSFDDVQGTDLQYLQKWMQHENVRVGIYRRAAEPREAWLGRVEFASLAAGIAIPSDNPQHAFAYTRRWTLRTPLAGQERLDPRDCETVGAATNCKDDLYELPVALWLIAERQRASAAGQQPRDPPEMRLVRMADRRQLEPVEVASGSMLELGTYAIDYSYLKDLKRDIIRLSADGPDGGPSPAIAVQIAAQRPSIAGRLVLVGDLEDTSDHFCYTPRMAPLPGVLVHASALATWNRSMLLQPVEVISPRVTWTLALLTLVCITGLRVSHSVSPILRQVPHQHLEMVGFLTLAVGVILGARWLAAANGHIWPDHLWVAGGLAIYACSDPLWRSMTAVSAVIRLAAAALDRRLWGG
jgi:serine/threonine protein kinase